ncbi:MAG: tryptophan synthase subunit alpha [Gemmataceae bacterium]|nr:tryptophan synthase subunit alpha [Gemmataceae bacterium]MDW8266756.1 tryptophan synthase subunit alpha [Gemmataceae bacterium]
MAGSECTIVVERRPDGSYRASCPVFPDCEAVAATEDEARQAVERAIETILARRQLNPIDAVFARLRGLGRKAFIPFVTAGDPDLDATAAVVRRLGQGGASVIEIGFPYSDPIADGPVIQASYTRALSRGLRVDDVFASVRRMTDERIGGEVPLVAMVSYSLVYRRGPARFLAEAQSAGFSGAILPDLPIEEADDLARLAAEMDFKLIQLVTPTTPPERAVRILGLASGFVYCVSVTGITGERDQLPAELLEQLRRLRRQTELPLCVGFGISKPEHVVPLREVADGVIVGSALVRRLAEADHRPLAAVLDEIGELVAGLCQALNPDAAATAGRAS